MAKSGTRVEALPVEAMPATSAGEANLHPVAHETRGTRVKWNVSGT